MIARLEQRLWQRPSWARALGLLALLVLIRYAPAVGGDWLRSGNDMRYFLDELQGADAERVWGWVTGPWIGRELFRYYRPVTSLAVFAQYRLFGEWSAPWQGLSLLLHAASTVILAELCSRIVHSRIAGLAAALVWAYRDRMALAIEWTPAQTDFLAVFFSLAALLTLKLYLDQSRWPWLLPSGLCALLAMGSKEVALILPGPAALLALDAFRQHRLSGRKAAAIIAGAALLAGAFLSWRVHALQGLGFLPGQAGEHSSGGASSRQLLPGFIRFLLPDSLDGSTTVPPLASVLAALTFYLVWRLRRTGSRRWWPAALAGFLAVTAAAGHPMVWIVPVTYPELASGIAWTGLLALALQRRRWDALLALGFGLVLWLPTYHVVYNRAGNVFYLPHVYWALLWAAISAAVLDYLGVTASPTSSAPARKADGAAEARP